jgi:formate-dependent nitrite reductase membrane component NrfD
MGVREPQPSSTVHYDGPTYYGQPAVKASSYGALVWGYTWLAGLAGSSQVLATIADLLGRADLRGVVRQGRALAAYLPVIGAGLLVADLHTPQRFYNMLRIFRATSPMSIGTYLLGAFSTTSIATAFAGATGRSRVATAVQLPAAAAGAGMSVYTGALLGATSTPLWSAAPRELTGRFGASAFGTAAAALSIGETLRGHAGNAAALQRVMAVAAVAEYGFAKASHRRYRERGVDGVLQEPEIAAGERAAMQLGVLLPLACVALDELTGRRSRAVSVVGALGMLAGGLIMRRTVFRAGNRSAQRPQDAFALTGPPGAAPSEVRP